ncbi:type IV pilus assembly protein PilN [Legionella beliardensis]|uniref:Type IV pilus assembly protein PilN n=1 Tax=Legionella beliardensis TaxID=91822 RepID=A0A378I0H5_9GAMM|nr:PilN domain-containing protein [Legionella beliardensis]STX28251.1 type IV pilus assembly protein PilN [Legionella beliardensis]
MTDINLLPWRERRREQEKKKFLTLLLGATFIGIGIVMLINYYVHDLINIQTARNQRLQDEINTFNRQIIEIKQLKEVRAGLISRMKIIQGLQARRTLTVYLFDELIKVVPDGIYLTQVTREGDKVTLQGYSESNTNVSILMRNIERSPWIKEPVLTEIKKSKEATTAVNNEFILSFVLKPKNAP